MTATQDLDVLFPTPSCPPSLLSPTPGAGITPESTETLVKLLKDNHRRFHCFINDDGFHNHLSHHLYAAFFLGATPALLEAAFELQARYQRPAIPSPSKIGIVNWKDHLGDEKFYNAYLAFFSTELLNHGVKQTLEKFFFSVDANWGTNENELHPEMVSRLLGGLVHPLIHAGHGVEFGQLGMVAEGLAQAAVHEVTTSALISRKFLAPSSSEAKNKAGTHLFNIIARMLKDEHLAPIEFPGGMRQYFIKTVNNRSDVIRGYAEAWAVDVSSQEAVGKRIEEIAWVTTLLYGVCGWKKDKPFQADFFMMHFVTSSLFLPSMLAHLSAESQRQLLRSYLVVLLAFWVGQGRPQLSIASFYEGTRTDDVPPGPQPTPHPNALNKEHVTPNPWYPILESTLMHPGEHLLKLERALAHYASLYGATPGEHFASTELEGAERLDGTLFLRVAWLSLKRNGWMREGEDAGGWDFDGFYDQ